MVGAFPTFALFAPFRIGDVRLGGGGGGGGRVCVCGGLSSLLSLSLLPSSSHHTPHCCVFSGRRNLLTVDSAPQNLLSLSPLSPLLVHFVWCVLTFPPSHCTAGHCWADTHTFLLMLLLLPHDILPTLLLPVFLSSAFLLCAHCHTSYPYNGN